MSTSHTPQASASAPAQQPPPSPSPAGRLCLQVRYFALLREQARLGQEAVETSASSPAALYAELSARHGFTLAPDLVRAVVNERYVAMDAVLTSGDRVVFIPPVAGG